MKIKNILLPLIVVPFISGCSGRVPGTRGYNIIDKELISNMALNSSFTATVTQVSKLNPEFDFYHFSAVKNADLTFSFYSLINNKNFFTGNIDSVNEDDSDKISILHIKVAGATTPYFKVYDSFGNLIYEISEADCKKVTDAGYLVDYCNPNVEVVRSRNNVYMKITSFDVEKGTVCKLYNWTQNGLGKEVPFSAMNSFIEMDLSSFGLEGYFLRPITSSTSLEYAIFYDDYLIGNISIPSTVMSTSIVGKSLIYQLPKEASKDLMDYDFMSGSIKLSLSTYVVDLTICKTTEIKMPYIANVAPFVDKHGHKTYGQIDVMENLNGQFLMKSYLVDQNFVIHDDVTKEPFFIKNSSDNKAQYHKMGTNLFNSASGVLRDENLKPIKILQTSTYEFVEAFGKGGVIRNLINGKYAFCDSNLNFLTDFEFEDYQISGNIIYAAGANYGIGSIGYSVFDGEKVVETQFLDPFEYGLNLLENTSGTYDIYYGLNKIVENTFNPYWNYFYDVQNNIDIFTLISDDMPRTTYSFKVEKVNCGQHINYVV